MIMTVKITEVCRFIVNFHESCLIGVFLSTDFLFDLYAMSAIGAIGRGIDFSGVDGWIWSAMSVQRINSWTSSVLLLTKRDIFLVNNVNCQGSMIKRDEQAPTGASEHTRARAHTQ